MNYYFIVAGIVGFLGGLAHTFLGDRWTVSPLNADNLASEQFTGDQNKRFLRWFWHIGSTVLLSTTALLVVQGLGLVEVQRQLLLYIAFLWLSTTVIFFVIAVRPPVQVFKMIPGVVGVPINLLIWAGLWWA